MSTYNDFYNSPSPGPGPGNTGPNRSGNNGSDDWIETLSWIIDIGMIFVWFPVGLFLTIANATGHNFVGSVIRSIRKSMKSSGGAQNVRAKTGFDVGQNRTTSSRVYGTQGQSASGGTYTSPSQETRQTQNESAPWTPKAASEEEKNADNVRRADKGATVQEVFGWIIGVFGILAAIGAIGDSLWTVLSALAIVLGGGALIFSGRKAKKKEAAFKRCFTVSGDKGVVKIAPLAKTLGMEEQELIKQLDEMVDRGYYGARAYIDYARGLLVIEPEQMRDVYKAEDEAKAATRAAKESADEMTSMSEYDKILQQIHQADLDIADEVMSEKIRTMQELTAAIFQEVEEHPAKKPQIQRFMNYYLPTTLKLLDSYARIEQQGVSGDNMAKAKTDIERIADTLVEGYKKQLDTLYQSEAVDIAGDVSVIESMMRRDGLAGGSDFRIRTEPQTEPAEDGEGQVLGGH